MTFSQIAAGVLLPFALTLAAVTAAPEPTPSVSTDRVFSLAGTWACAAADGSRTIRQVGTREGDRVDVVRTVQPAKGEPYTAHDRYAFDPAAGLWRVDFDAGTPGVLHAMSTVWNAGDRTWSAVGRDAQGKVQRVRFEMVGTKLARTQLREEPPASSHWVAHGSELCARGDEPPKLVTCAVPNVAARTIVAAAPSMNDVPPGTPSGTVQVVIALDEQSHITSAAIVSSTAPALNPVALRSARASQFQTEIRDCRPIAAKYIYTIDFNR